jgi:hypothetical protein
MFNKITVLAVAAGAVAALALPATASATWKHHGVPIQNDISGSVTGKARFQGALGGIECQAIASAVFFANQTTGQIQSYGPHPGNETTECKGLGGLAPCQIHDWTTSVPWTFHTTTTTVHQHIPAKEGEPTKETKHHFYDNTLTITTGETSAQFTGGIFCLIKKTVSTPGELTITPNQPNTITSGQISGTLWQDIQTNGGGVDKETITISGTGAIVAPDAHTYDI